MDIDQMRHFIKNFSFDQCKRGSQGFDRILIQLFGIIGHGKSAFINTCIYVWEDGEFHNWAKASAADGAVTTERTPYKLTENITLVDNRCIPYLVNHTLGETFAELSNLLPIGTTVEFRKGFELVERIIKAEKKIKSSDFVFPVFVHSLQIFTNPEMIKEEFKFLFQSAQTLTGVVPIVVLTHKTRGNLTEVETMFRDIGVDKIFSLENYTMEDHMKTRARHEEVLKFLCEVIKDVQFCVEQPQDLQKEKIVRKKFVLNYIHEFHKKEEQRKWEMNKAKERALQEKKLKEQGEKMKRQRLEEQRRLEEELRKKQEEMKRQRLRE